MPRLASPVNVVPSKTATISVWLICGDGYQFDQPRAAPEHRAARGYGSRLQYAAPVSAGFPRRLPTESAEILSIPSRGRHAWGHGCRCRSSRQATRAGRRPPGFPSVSRTSCPDRYGTTRTESVARIAVPPKDVAFFKPIPSYYQSIYVDRNSYAYRNPTFLIANHDDPVRISAASKLLNNAGDWGKDGHAF